jgi:hypothetical protein
MNRYFEDTSTRMITRMLKRMIDYVHTTKTEIGTPSSHATKYRIYSLQIEWCGAASTTVTHRR